MSSRDTIFQTIENDFKYDYDFTGDYDPDGSFVMDYQGNGTHRLVPVEPNYEAAGSVLGRLVEPILKDGSYLDWRWIKQVVDAALGIKGGQMSKELCHDAPVGECSCEPDVDTEDTSVEF